MASELSAPIEGAVEVVADALHVPGCNHYTGGPSECYSRALSAVTALATAGLIATEPQWGTEIPGAHVIPWSSEADARKMGGLTGHSVKVRYTSASSWGDA